jgi:hypothetical protein
MFRLWVHSGHQPVLAGPQHHHDGPGLPGAVWLSVIATACRRPILIADSAQQRREGAHFGLCPLLLGLSCSISFRGVGSSDPVVRPASCAGVAHTRDDRSNTAVRRPRSSVGVPRRQHRGMPEGYRPSATSRRKIP